MIGSALVDRARVVRRLPTLSRVGGSTVFVEEFSPWFKVRLTLGEAVEADVGGRRRVSERPSLLVGVRDEEHGLVVLTTECRLEVVSKSLLGEGVVAVFDVVIRRRCGSAEGRLGGLRR